ncbi:hypothetical protein [Microbacterium elymi]|uniref:Uncharacterized protein n=1 Tax=Microbacterium elymi TaxID=2909587 RepID=A0ABY5NJ30_9MICO|nr:hypothetical protein [Microbacterium elymi]UUT35182.1 hypothetical protein L2X98_33615 [Microbacterium elymi]
MRSRHTPTSCRPRSTRPPTPACTRRRRSDVAPKQLINLLGLLVVLAVVVIGVVAVALPLYSQSVTTDGQTAQVTQTNQGYDIQVQALQAAKKNLPQTQQEVAQLRRQITAQGRLDDAFEIAITAAAATKSTITQMTAADTESFAPRTTVGEDGKAAAPTPAPAATSSTDAAASGSSATDAATTDAAAAGGAATPAPAPAADPRKPGAVHDHRHRAVSGCGGEVPGRACARGRG